MGNKIYNDMTTKRFQEIRDKIDQASRVRLSIRMEDGTDRIEYGNRALFELIVRREHLAVQLMKGEVQFTDDGCELFEKYNEDIRKIIGL